MSDIIKQARQLLALKDVKDFNYIGKDGYIFKIDEPNERLYLTPDIGGSSITIPINQIRVSTEYGDDNTGIIGSYENAFQTISAASNYARGLIVGDPTLKDKILINVEQGEYLDENDIMFDGEIHCEENVNIFVGVGTALFTVHTTGEVFRLTGFPNITGQASGAIWLSAITETALSMYIEVDNLVAFTTDTIYCEEIKIFTKLADIGLSTSFHSVNFLFECFYWVAPAQGYWTYYEESISSTKSHQINYYIHYYDGVTNNICSSVMGWKWSDNYNTETKIHIENGTTTAVIGFPVYAILEESLYTSTNKYYISSNGMTCPSILRDLEFGGVYTKSKDIILSGTWNCTDTALYKIDEMTLKNLVINAVNDQTLITADGDGDGIYDVMGSLTLNTTATPEYDPTVTLTYISDLPTASASSSKIITKVAHGFSVGDVLGNGYVLASAIGWPLPAIGMVITVIDVDTFEIQFSGIIDETPTTYTDGADYYLDTLGGVTPTYPLESVQSIFRALEPNKIFLDIDNMFVDESIYIPFKILIETIAPDESFYLPASGSVNVVVDWGDDTSSNETGTPDPHIYTLPGQYIISVKGLMTRFSGTSISDEILEVLDWGITNLDFITFSGCANLNSVPADYAGSFSKLTNMSDIFRYCDNLTSIPSGLLDYATNMDDIGWGFTSSGLTSIPVGLFDNCVKLADVTRLFNDTPITSIPAGLFDNNPLLTTISTTFASCPGLTSIPENLFINNPLITYVWQTFQSSSNITSLPNVMFTDGVEVFDSVFESCTGLTSIPTTIFNNSINAITFLETFKGCTGLTSIPNTLFDSNVNTTGFGGTFYNCTSLATIPSGLFDNNILTINFTTVFYNCAITSIPTGLFDLNVNIESFSTTFAACSSLTTIPSTLFDLNVNAEIFQSVFAQCTSLVTIPSGLFDNNSAATTFSGVFHTCSSLTTIPIGLFNNKPNLVGYVGGFMPFSSVFSHCTSLVTVPNIFDNCPNTYSMSRTFDSCTSLTTLPANLFPNNISNFWRVFIGCTGLIELPLDLFANIAVSTDYDASFESCSNLTTLPANLFNKSVGQNFRHMFWYCSSISSIPPTLLNGIVGVPSFWEMFDGATGLTGLAPELWIEYPTAVGTECFRGGTGLTNYGDIPVDWK